MIKRVGGALIGLVLVLLALVIGAMPASAGRLAGGGLGTSAFTFEPLQPGPPTGLSATAVSSSEVDLSWTAPSSGSPTVSYDVYDGTSPDGESNTPVNSAPITGTTFAVTGLSSGTTYYFLVLARDAAGFGTYSNNEASATTPASGGLGPPTGLSATAVSSSEVDLSWTAPSGSAAGYNVYEGTSPGGESNTPVNSAPITGTTFAVTGLSSGTTYYFEVYAVDAAGNESDASNEASATTPASGGLGPPTGLSATAVSSSEVDLSWTAPSGSAAGYNVYEGTSPGGESNTPVNSAPITGTTFAVTGLSSGTTYYFEVYAVDAASNESHASNEASATTPASGGLGPPTGLSATAVSSSEVDLSWTAPSGSAAGYNVYEGTSPGGESNTPVNSAPITGTTFAVTGLSSGTTYYFEVYAVDAASNESHASNEASASTPAPGPTTGPAGTSAQPWLVIVALAVIGGAIAGALVAVRRRRSRSASAPGSQAAAGSGIQAVPHAGPPDVVSIHATGTGATHTVRFVPDPGTCITTIEEAPPR